MVIAKPRMGILSLHLQKHTDEGKVGNGGRRWRRNSSEHRKKKMTRRLELPSAGGGEE